MKYVQFILFSVVVELTKINSHVTERSKNVEIDTTPTSLEKGKILSKDTSEKKYEHDKVWSEENRVYLEDVLFTLKNQQWEDEEMPCLDDIYRLLYGLQNFTLWAVWDWDALASEPQGLLFGNRYQLGNFDQCINAPWSKTHPELRTKYCLAEIILQRTDKAVRRRPEKPLDPYKSALDYIQYPPVPIRPLNELTWGACVPLTCQSRTVERLLGVMMARSHLGYAGMRANITIDEKCQTSEKQKKFDGLFCAFFIVMGAFTLMCLVCTYLNSCNTPEYLNAKKSNIIKAFCIKENALDLFKMKKEGTEFLYGVRYITICLIVLGHQMGIYNSGSISDGLSVDQMLHSPVGLLFLHDDLFVDTFFILSGFLAFTNFMKFKRMPNPIILILKRYVRLVVAFAVMVFYMSAVFPYTGSGPLWNRAVAHETEQCRKNWWLSLLMVSNYIDTENICLVISWYIPCDFHFFVLTVAVFWLYKRCPKLGVPIAAVLSVAAIVVPGVVSYIYQLAAIQLFTLDFVTDPRGQQDFHVAYIKSHMRYAAYLVGCYSGYIFIKFSADGNMKKIKQKWSVLGTCFSVLLMVFTMIYGGTFLWRIYSPLEGAVYAALNRPVWAAGIGLLIFCCSFGNVPLVKSFLSWYPWVPLSRLSYGLYLTHTAVITRNVFSIRNPQHNDYFEIMNSAVGVIVLGTLAALVIWLLVEGPINMLLTMYLTPKVTNKITTNEENGAGNAEFTIKDNIIPSTSTGYLNDNLPSNLELSSKV